MDRIIAHDLEKPGDCHWSAIVDNGRAVGEVMLHWRPSGIGEIGCSLHPDHQGRGWATEASWRMFEVGFALGIEQICGVCDPRNQQSVKGMTRIGMRPAPSIVEPGWEGLLIFAIDQQTFDLDRHSRQAG